MARTTTKKGTKVKGPSAQTRIASRMPKVFDPAGVDSAMAATIRGEGKRRQAIKALTGKAKSK